MYPVFIDLSNLDLTARSPPVWLARICRSDWTR